MDLIIHILLVIGAIILYWVAVLLSPVAYGLALTRGRGNDYLRNVAVAHDQTANALIGGDEDETISSRMGKLVRAGSKGFPYVMCRIMHPIDKHHCQNSIEEDEGDSAVIK